MDFAVPVDNRVKEEKLEKYIEDWSICKSKKESKPCTPQNCYDWLVYSEGNLLSLSLQWKTTC